MLICLEQTLWLLKNSNSLLLDSQNFVFVCILPSIFDRFSDWLGLAPLHRLFFLIIVAEGNLARASLGCHVCRCVFFKSFFYSVHVGLEQLARLCVWRFSPLIGTLIFVSSQGRNLVLEVWVKESTLASPSHGSWSCSLGACSTGVPAPWEWGGAWTTCHRGTFLHDSG